MSDRLVDRYDLTILDLDGVVYLDEEVIPAAARAIGALRRESHRVAYATNNASRRPELVARLLVGMGVPARDEEIVTSAQAAAALLARRLPAGAPVLIVGAPALRDEIASVGLTPVDRADVRPAAVVQGYAREVGWAQLAEACVAVRHGARWVATNGDRTLPSPRGPLPGNGAMVAALATALDRGPDDVAGKPDPTLFRQAAGPLPPARCLVVGDRLDTDIEGARRADMPSLLVLSGVATARDLLTAPPSRRPSYVGADLGALFARPDDVAVPPVADKPRPGAWTARRDGAVITLAGSGDPMNALRALCSAAWAGPASDKVTAASAAAAEVLRRFHLAD